MKLAMLGLLVGCVQPIGEPPTITTHTCTPLVEADKATVTCTVRFKDVDGDVDRVDYDVMYNSKTLVIPGKDLPELAGKQTGSAVFDISLGTAVTATAKGTIYLTDAGNNEASVDWSVEVTK
jgi:hypothetical protein